ncbi:MAG: hypothetical protein AB1750_00975 [Chloroflexota bacterium]
MEKEQSVSTNLFFFVGGLALIFLSHTSLENSYPSLTKGIEALGFALVGYAPIRIIMTLGTWLRDNRTEATINKLLKSTVRIVSLKGEMPIFIAVDVEGCLTPPQRSEISLRKFQKIRGYGEFVKSENGKNYPPLVIYTGRSQGYVELLAQSLGLINDKFDLPFVIENGSALYFPASKRTYPLITGEQRKIIFDVYELLSADLPHNEFEPKSYMVSVNAVQDSESIDELREKIILILEEKNLLKDLTVSSTASAVDITLKDVNKLTGINEVIKIFHDLHPEKKEQGLTNLVVLADSTSDLPVIKKVGQAFCPAQESHPEVRSLIEKLFGSDHLINERQTDFVIAVIEKVCGLKLL